MTTEPPFTAGSALPDVPASLPDDAPDADAVEQALPAVPPSDDDLRAADPRPPVLEADDYDVAEQAAVVADGEDEYR